jgi:hypothetical protein
VVGLKYKKNYEKVLWINKNLPWSQPLGTIFEENIILKAISKGHIFVYDKRAEVENNLNILRVFQIKIS